MESFRWKEKSASRANGAHCIGARFLSLPYTPPGRLMVKIYTHFQTKSAKNQTVWGCTGCTYLYNLYRGVPPPPGPRYIPLIKVRPRLRLHKTWHTFCYVTHVYACRQPGPGCNTSVPIKTINCFIHVQMSFKTRKKSTKSSRDTWHSSIKPACSHS